MVERTNFSEETISKVLTKLTATADETKIICSNADEAQ
jgi:hypothetical protein